MATMNYYRDSEERYHNDNEFRAVVDVLMVAAVNHGFTPGELKQAAFFAAYMAEIRYGGVYRMIDGVTGRYVHPEDAR
jgi:hypothetical protein